MTLRMPNLGLLNGSQGSHSSTLHEEKKSSHGQLTGFRAVSGADDVLLYCAASKK